MENVDRMIRLFDEECKLISQDGMNRSWMSESKARKEQESVERKLKLNRQKQENLASKMTFKEKEELYLQTEVNLNE